RLASGRRSPVNGAMETFAPEHPAMQTPAIWHPSAPREDYDVVLFRRRFHLASDVEPVRVWLSASQRFAVWLDGQLLRRGPARSDEDRWGCVPVELGPLKAGEHTLAVRAWHFGRFAGKAQLGGPAFFLCAPEDRDLADLLASGPSWRCHVDAARLPHPARAGSARGHTAVGAGEEFRAADHPWGWREEDFDDGGWQTAAVVCPQAGNPWGNRRLGHHLRPETLPAMAERDEAWSRVADANGDGPPADWLSRHCHWTIPAASRLRVVLDRGAITNAYPRLCWSGGAGASIECVTCEAPTKPDSREKGNRDEIACKELPGMVDRLLCDGGEDRCWEPLWFRSFRYFVLDIRTGEQPLRLSAPELRLSCFPAERGAKLEVDDPAGRDWPRLMRVSWRTAELCSHETFFDCPHYEQAQFPGDGRIQARYHYVIANDDRLPRKAIDDLHAGRVYSGLLRSHYPATMHQVISTYSLQWLGMLHEMRIYRGGGEFLPQYLPAARAVMDWFTRRRRCDGLVGRVMAPFTDWARNQFEAGNAPQESDGGSSIVTCLLAEAAGWMAGLERSCGWPELADRWEQLSEDLTRAVGQRCWDPGRRLYADTPAGRTFSVHAQVQAVLAGMDGEGDAADLLRRAIGSSDVTQPNSLYYRAHLAEALRRAGLGDEVHRLLGAWWGMLDGTGLTTWPESDVNPRSDCHGWGVMPEIELVQTVLGITPDPSTDGMQKLRFAPCLGELRGIRGRVATPAGVVEVRLRRAGEDVMAELNTPVPTEWQGRDLLPGRHELCIG
ncbi:MAG: hypothetical protein ACLFV7_06375, partial [Phycisphaerae bacterium]